MDAALRTSTAHQVIRAPLNSNIGVTLTCTLHHDVKNQSANESVYPICDSVRDTSSSFTLRSLCPRQTVACSIKCSLLHLAACW